MPDPTKWSPPSSDEVVTESSWTPPASDIEEGESKKKVSTELNSGGSPALPSSSASASEAPSTLNEFKVNPVTSHMLSPMEQEPIEDLKAHIKKNVYDNKLTTPQAIDSYVDKLKNIGYSKYTTDQLKEYAGKVNQSVAVIKGLKAHVEGADIVKPPEYAPEDVKQNYIAQKQERANDRNAHYALGVAELHNDDPQAAINFFSKALTMPPAKEQQPTQGFEGNLYPQKSAATDSNSLYGIGYAYQQLGQKDQAAQFYNDAIKADSHNADALKGLSSIAYKNGNKEASRQLQIAAQQVGAPKRKLEEMANEYRYEKAHENDTNEYLKSMADALEDTLIKGKGQLGWLNPFAYAGQAVMSGIEKGVETLKEVPNDVMSMGASGNPALRGITGLSEIGLGVLMATPEGIAFNTGAGIGETVLPSELTNLIMQPGSSLLNYIDNHPSDNKKMLASVGDVLGQALLLKGVHGKTLAEKFKSDTPLTPEEYKQLQEIAPTITSEEVSEASKNVIEQNAKNSIKDEKLEGLLKEKAPLEQSLNKDVSEESKAMIKQKIVDLDSQIANRKSELTEEHKVAAEKEGNKENITNQVSSLQKDADVLTGDAKKMVADRIDTIKKENGIEEVPESEKEENIKPIMVEGTPVIEHGEDVATAEGLDNGIKPTDLTEDGKKQAERIGKYVKENGVTEIVTSPVQRAVQTGEIASKISGAALKVNENLATWDIGKFDGKPDGDFNEEHYIKSDEAPKGGEKFSDFTDRMQKAYKEVVDMPKETQVIAHSKVLRAFKALEKTEGKWTEDTTKEFLKLTKKEEHAIPKSSTGKIHEREQSGNGEKGSERGRVEPVVEGNEVAKEGGVEPPKIIRESHKENVEPEKKLRSIEKRINESDLSEDIKTELRKNDWGYVPERIDLNAENAKKLVDLHDTDNRLDSLLDKVLNKSNEITPATRDALAPKLWEAYRKKIDEAKEAGDMASSQKYLKKLTQVMNFDKAELTKSAQKLNVSGKLWKQTLGKYPEVIINQLKDKINEDRAKALEGKQKELKDYKDFIDHFIQSEEFDKLVAEKVKVEVDKLGTKGKKKENIFNSKEFRDKRKVELKEKWKQSSGSASASLVGLNKEQIEVLGEMGAIYLAEGAHSFVKWVKKMQKEFDGVTDEQLEYIWRNAKLPEDLDEKQRSLKDFATIGRFEKMTAEEKKVLLDKMGTKIKGMSEDRRKQFLSDIIDEVEKMGGLDEERFKDLYAKAMGLPYLTDEAQAHIYETTKKIAEVDKVVDEYQKAYEDKASVKDLKDLANKLDKAKEDARYANDKLSDYFKKEKSLGDIMSAAIQGNLMTLITAQTNVVGNLSKGLLTAPAARGVTSGLDFLLSKAAKLPVFNKFIKEGRTRDALAYWKGAIPAIPQAFVKAARGIIKGSTALDYTVRDTHTKIEPIKAWESIIDTIKRDKKSSAYQVTKDVIEGIGGATAEPLFRIMNAGDKLFTHLAEQGTKSEMASVMGLKGEERERFMTLTPESLLKEIGEKASEYTFQEDSGAAQTALKIKKQLIDLVPESAPQPVKDIWKTLVNLQIPFIKTPVNVLNYMIDLAIPEIALAKSVWHGAIMKDRGASLDSLGRAVVGFGIRSVLNSAAQNNLLTPMISDEDSKSAKSFKLGGADVKPGQINITAFNRMISGGDATPLPTDTWINYKYYGLFAINMNLAAQNKQYYNTPEGSEIEDYGNMVLGTVKNLPKNVLEQTFLSGLNTLLDAIASPDKFNRWATNTTVAGSSMLYPNTIAQLSKFSQPEQKDVRVDQGTNWEKFVGTLKNTFKDRMFMGSDLPSKITIWGEKVNQLPENADPAFKYMYALFDAYKPNQVNPDSFQYQLYKVFDQAPADKKNQLLPTLPKRGTINVAGVKVPISESQYQDLSIYVGQARKQAVEEYILSDEFKEQDLKEKIKNLKAIYRQGLVEGKEAFLEAHPEIEEVAEEDDE